MTSMLAYLRKTRLPTLPGRLFPAVMILLGWEIAVRMLTVRPDVLPPPSRIVLELWQSRHLLQPAALITFAGVILGLGSAAAAGLALGITLAVRNDSHAFPEILKVPLLALAPLMLIWFGWGLAPRVILAFLVSLLTITASMVEGLRSVPQPMQRFLRGTAKRSSAARLAIEFRVALPHFLNSLGRATGYSFAAVVTGEFAGAEGGLGHLALEASSKHNMPLLFATLAVMGVFLLLLQRLCGTASRLLVDGKIIAFAGGSGHGSAGPPIDAVSLNIKEGEFFSVVAASGVNPPHPSTGCVPCEPVLAGWMTVLENVLLPCRLNGPNEKNRLDRARWLMESLGLSGLENKRPGSLSPEQAQRVCLCRALILSPPMLVLENPFRILDSVARERLASDLELLWLHSRFTVLLVTGQIDEAVRLSDRVALMCPSSGGLPEIIEIGIPRPRRLDSRTTPAIMEYSARIRILLRARGLLH